jgi:hypothetical protein
MSFTYGSETRPPAGCIKCMSEAYVVMDMTFKVCNPCWDIMTSSYTSRQQQLAAAVTAMPFDSSTACLRLSWHAMMAEKKTAANHAAWTLVACQKPLPHAAGMRHGKAAAAPTNLARDAAAPSTSEPHAVQRAAARQPKQWRRGNQHAIRQRTRPLRTHTLLLHNQSTLTYARVQTASTGQHCRWAKHLSAWLCFERQA